MFSNTVKLADLDDFLNPAQECVKPLLESISKDATTAKVDVGDFEVRPNLIRPSKQKRRTGDGTAATQSVEAPVSATVNLYDCLACSGCVTSAEAVLIQQQGTEEFVNAVRRFPVSVVSVSPQSLTALAVHFNLPPATMFRKLCGLLKSLGVTYVLDMAASDAIALLETRAEFAERYARHITDSGGRHLPLLTSHCPGWVCYAEKVLDSEIISHMSKVMSSQQIQGRLVKALIPKQHSAMKALWRYRLDVGLPGVVPSLMNVWRRVHQLSDSRYVDASAARKSVAVNGDGTNQSGDQEAASGDARVESLPHVLPKIVVDTSRVMSGVDVHHTCIMPCYDKKLEAVRPDFRVELKTEAEKTASLLLSDGSNVSHELSSQSVPEVDTVLATSEILELMRIANISIEDVAELEIDDMLLGISSMQFDDPRTGKIKLNGKSVDPMNNRLASSGARRALTVPLHSNFGSGGFVEDVFRYSAWSLFGVKLHTDERLRLESKRNTDYKDVVVQKDGVVVLRFATAYGFRNIQNVMRVLKGDERRSAVGTDEFVPHFVEIMACPGGCLNGGGQLPDLPMAATNTASTSTGTDTPTVENGDAISGKVVGALESESIDRRKLRMDKLEHSLHTQSQEVKVVPVESNRYALKIYNVWKALNNVVPSSAVPSSAVPTVPSSAAVPSSAESTNSFKGGLFTTSFKSLKPIEGEGVILPSALKW
eukprot:Lankesteria_metandrocarpae@DN4343_c0_g1_i1.p1